jgi:hypothetical protein
LTAAAHAGTVAGMDAAVSPVTQARELMRSLDRATLASALPAELAVSGGDGAAWPYASLVLVAVDHDLSPILLLSTLAEHSKAMAANPAVSLLLDGTAGLAQPLTGPRLTVLGRARRTSDTAARRRFLARHPEAAMYADFGDFHFYRLTLARAHLVAGFGRITWIEAADLVGEPPPAALVAAEAEIVAHMNADHAAAVQLYANVLLGRGGQGWRMTGIDTAGCDLRQAGDVARLAFPTPVSDAESARVTLVALVQQARRNASP